jgi:hypothetical protein
MSTPVVLLERYLECGIIFCWSLVLIIPVEENAAFPPQCGLAPQARLDEMQQHTGLPSVLCLSSLELHQEGVWRDTLPILTFPVEQHRRFEGQILCVLCHLNSLGCWCLGWCLAMCRSHPSCSLSRCECSDSCHKDLYLCTSCLLSWSPRGFPWALPHFLPVDLLVRLLPPPPPTAPPTTPRGSPTIPRGIAPCAAAANLALSPSVLRNCSCTSAVASGKLGTSEI